MDNDNSTWLFKRYHANVNFSTLSPITAQYKRPITAPHRIGILKGKQISITPTPTPTPPLLIHAKVKLIRLDSK
jgi:hypothetical protein